MVLCTVLFYFLLYNSAFASTINTANPIATQSVIISNVSIGSFVALYSPCDTIGPYTQGTGPTSRVGQDFYFDPIIADFGCVDADYWRENGEYRILVFPERFDDTCSFMGQVQDAFNTICASQASERFNFNVFVPLPTFIVATGGSKISPDKADDIWVPLTGPVIYEGASSDIGDGTIILDAPPGFVFDTEGVAPTVLVINTAGSNNIKRNINGLVDGSTIEATVTSTQLVITITQITSRGTTNSLTWQNVRIRPIAGASLERGNITKAGTSSIKMISEGTTSLGILAETVDIVISGLSNDSVLAKNKTWSWDSNDATAMYRFAIDQNPEGTPTGEYGEIKTASQSSGDGTYYLHVEAKDAFGNENSVTTVSAVLDNTAPTVTKLGDDSEDFALSEKDTDLLFSESLSDSSQKTVQNSLTAGANGILTYTWLGDALTINASGSVTFNNDVVVNISDVSGNTATLLIIDSTLSKTQTVPDSKTGIAVVDSATPQVVITDPIQAVNLTISDGTINPTLDVSSFITEGTGILPEIIITSANANNTNLSIPASTSVTSADLAWDGIIAAPTITTVTLPVVEGETTTLSTAIEVGFIGAKLSFDKAVRILLTGQAGKKAGYIRTGTVFTEITNTCALDDQTTGNELVSDGDCKIDVDKDLIIWTKHFTTFATYTQTSTPTPKNNGGGGGGGNGVGEYLNGPLVNNGGTVAGATTTATPMKTPTITPTPALPTNSGQNNSTPIPKAGGTVSVTPEATISVTPTPSVSPSLLSGSIGGLLSFGNGNRWIAILIILAILFGVYWLIRYKFKK